MATLLTGVRITLYHFLRNGQVGLKGLLRVLMIGAPPDKLNNRWFFSSLENSFFLFILLKQVIFYVFNSDGEDPFTFSEGYLSDL